MNNPKYVAVFNLISLSNGRYGDLGIAFTYLFPLHIIKRCTAHKKLLLGKSNSIAIVQL